MKRSVWVVSFMTLLLLGCLATSGVSTPTPLDRACTAMGCGFTLQIELVGEVPPEFVLRVESSDGERVSVHCRAGVVVYDAQTTSGKSPMCGMHQVAFLDYSPPNGTLSFESDDINVARDFQPDYQVFQPNGLGCEPQCRSARVEFVLP